jgi:hypothetical protein
MPPDVALPWLLPLRGDKQPEGTATGAGLNQLQIE